MIIGEDGAGHRYRGHVFLQKMQVWPAGMARSRVGGESHRSPSPIKIIHACRLISGKCTPAWSQDPSNQVINRVPIASEAQDKRGGSSGEGQAVTTRGVQQMPSRWCVVSRGATSNHAQYSAWIDRTPAAGIR
jgi:hypothetical protein